MPVRKYTPGNSSLGRHSICLAIPMELTGVLAGDICSGEWHGALPSGHVDVRAVLCGLRLEHSGTAACRWPLSVGHAPTLKRSS